MDRKGAYVKRATKLTIPGVIFAIHLRPYHDARTIKQGLDTQGWYGAECAVSHRRRGKWSAPSIAVVTTGDALREWMDDNSASGRLNWVIAESATDVLTLSEWWAYAESLGIRFADRRRGNKRLRADARDSGGVRVSQFVVSGGPDIITYTERGTAWRWVSASNYWPDGCPVGRAAGTDSRLDGGREDDDGRHVRPVGDTPSVALLTRFRGLCRWWGRVATAPLGCTAGQCAWGVLRSHVAERGLCSHSDPDAHRLERASAHGGRASVWFVRAVGAQSDDDDARLMLSGAMADARPSGPIAHVDVSSMYPALLRDEQYPVKIGPKYFGMRPDALIGLARGFGVIARVRVTTSRGEYPLRTERGTIYPTGTFTTTLAGPDLLKLVNDGEIKKVFECATYTLGNPFRDALQALLDVRAEAKRAGDGATEALSKLVANSLAGRFAKREGGWVRRAALDGVNSWGETHMISAQRDCLARFRWIASAAWEYVETAEPRGPHTAVFAYLSAYGRQKMRAIRDILPARTVVAQDTDGLFVLPEGIRALTYTGMSERIGPGELRVTGTASSGIWYGPRHYRFGSKWVLAGIPYESLDERDMTVTYSSRTPLFSARANVAPTEVHRVRRTVAIPTDIECGRVQPDGWILPPHKIPGRTLED